MPSTPRCSPRWQKLAGRPRAVTPLCDIKGVVHYGTDCKRPARCHLGQYKGLAFTRRVRPVSEKAVEADIANLTRVHAPFVPAGDPAARGMRVTLDFEGFMDGAPIPDSRMEKVTVVLGTGQLMPAAEDAVYGHYAGETFRFDFTYPAEFRVPELSGKTAQFAICLHTVEHKQVPPVDDAFAKTLGYADLDALKESIREKKRLSHEANADRIAGAALLDMAGANLTVELPTSFWRRTPTIQDDPAAQNGCAAAK